MSQDENWYWVFQQPNKGSRTINRLWSTLVDLTELTRDYDSEKQKMGWVFVTEMSPQRANSGSHRQQRSCYHCREQPLKESFWEPYMGSHQRNQSVEKALIVWDGSVIQNYWLYLFVCYTWEPGELFASQSRVRSAGLSLEG